MPKDEEPLTDLISRLRALLAELFLQDRDLHFELVDPVFEEEDFSSFGIDIPAGQALEAASANPP